MYTSAVGTADILRAMLFIQTIAKVSGGKIAQRLPDSPLPL